MVTMKLFRKQTCESKGESLEVFNDDISVNRSNLLRPLLLPVEGLWKKKENVGEEGDEKLLR